MKITVDARQLSAACDIIKHVAHRAPGLHPICQYARFRAENGQVVVLATDMEQEVSIPLQGTVEEAGRVAVPIAGLRQFVKREKGTITIGLDEKTAVIEGRKNGDLATLHLPTGEGRGLEEPPLVAVEGEEVNLGADFAHYVGMAATHAAVETSRPVLTSIFIETDGNGGGAVVAADGFRLFEKKLPVDAPAMGMLVPPKAAQTIRRFMKGETRVVFNPPPTVGPPPADPRMGQTRTSPVVGGHARFEAAGLSMVVELTRGQFPAYRVLIPPSREREWVVECSGPALVQRLEQFVALSGITRLRKHQDEGLLAVTSKGEDEVEFEAAIPATVMGDAKIGVNQAYLAIAARYFAAMKIEGNSVSSPIKVTGDVEGLTIVIMPMFVVW